MNSVLIHGCFDGKTLQTLKDLGVKKFSFDLRARSPNLVPYHHLVPLLKSLPTEQIFLTFENDKSETVLSLLDLLKEVSGNFALIFRDHQDSHYYKKIGRNFYWMFTPEGDWREILSLGNAAGVFLPLKYQNIYHKLPALWALIDEKDLDVFLYAENFEMTNFINFEQDIKLCLDLTAEVEKGYRTVDQEKLKSLKFWRKLNENFDFER